MGTLSRVLLLLCELIRRSRRCRFSFVVPRIMLIHHFVHPQSDFPILCEPISMPAFSEPFQLRPLAVSEKTAKQPTLLHQLILSFLVSLVPFLPSCLTISESRKEPD